MPDIKYAPIPEDGEGSSAYTCPAPSAPEPEVDLEQRGMPPPPTDPTINPVGLPENPPSYSLGQFEQFEIEDPHGEAGSDDSSQSAFVRKANQFARGINNRIFRPINDALDPVYEAWQYANNKIDAAIGKVGNPLIIKRLLYVFLVAFLIYMISASGIENDGSTYYGSFHDLQTLANFVDGKIDPHRLEENLEYLSSMPHMAGSAGDLALARYVQQYIRKTNIQELNGESFQAYANYPTNNSYVKLINGDLTIHECNLIEDAGSQDDDSKGLDEISRFAYNPGARSGSAKGHVVYANYGTLQDYANLEKSKVNLKNDFIAIVKYGGKVPTYTKVKNAHKKGAKAVVFVSDPTDHSYTMGSIQRDPVAYPDIAQGNIMDPGAGAADQVPDYFDAHKLLDTSVAYPGIPSIPISWTDFKAIMDATKGQGQRMKDWDVKVDGKNIEVWTGSEDYLLDLKNELLEKPFKEMWNVLGRIDGTEQDGLALVIGASRDSVCYGATEATGTAVLLELMSVFSEMMSSLSWRPLRSIYFVSFSGTKFNLAGAANLMAGREDFIKRDAYTYIDLSDAIAGDSFHFTSNPMLYTDAIDVLNTVEEPKKNDTLFSAWNRRYNYEMDPAQNYAPFADRGVLPSLKVGFDRNGAGNYPKNSCLDTFKRYQDQKIDPGMKYHRTLTNMIANEVLHLTDKPIIPFDIYSLLSMIDHNYSDLRTYAEQLNSHGKTMGNLQYTEFEKTLIRMKELSRDQQAFENTWRQIVQSASGIEPNLLAVNRWDWNSKLSVLQKVISDEGGTFHRPWQRNVLFGRQLEIPNEHSSNGEKMTFKVDSFPGVRDALSQGDWKGAQDELNKVTVALQKCADIFRVP